MIKVEKNHCQVEGETEEVVAEFSCVYNALLNNGISEEIIMYGLELIDKKRKKKPKIIKIEIDADTKEEAMEQIEDLDIPKRIKTICKNYINEF